MRRHFINIFFSIMALLVTVTLAQLPAYAFNPDTPNTVEKKPKNTASILNKAYGSLPMYFVSNDGQAGPDILYYERTGEHATYFTKTGVTLGLYGGAGDDRSSGAEAVRLGWTGARSDVEIIGEGLTESRVNFILGARSEKWLTDVPTYSSVVYKGLYDGVDVRFYGNNTRLEYDVIVGPGADPGQVAYSYEGVKELRMTREGDLEMVLDNGVVKQTRPYIYQEIDGGRVEVSGSFRIIDASGGSEEPSYGFTVGDYDRTRELVIDPVIVYSTYFTGNGEDRATDAVVDSAGNIYITGITKSTDIVTVSPISGPLSSATGGSDVFVTKIDPTGTSILYSTYFGSTVTIVGGPSSDEPYGIDLDPSGNIYIAGITNGFDFPTSANPIAVCNGCQHQYFDLFVTKLSADGSAIVYSTYLGGEFVDWAAGIAVDSTGAAYVTGFTSSIGFLTANPIYARSGGTEAYVLKVNPDGASLAYSTFLGGSLTDYGKSIAVDSTGAAYVTGYTQSNNFPKVSPIYSSITGAGTFDAFVAKVNPAGTALEYSTLIGGSGNDYGRSIAVDSTGAAYLAGDTESTDYPMVSALYTSNAGDKDAFITKLDPAGTSIAYSTYIGGSGTETTGRVAVDQYGNAFLAGNTSSVDLPTASPLQSSLSGTQDVFLSVLDSTGSSLAYSSYLGGSGGDLMYTALAVDESGNAYIAGLTSSTDFPTVSPIQAGCNNCAPAVYDTFVTKVHINDAPTLAYTSEGGYTQGLSPQAGTASTTFSYKAVYTDANGQAPSYIKACVDGSCTDMVLDTDAAAALQDGDYTNGEQFVHTATLAAGAHDYYFSAGDSVATVTLPSSGAVSGPTVSDLAITTTSLPSVYEQTAYSSMLAAQGGTIPYSWSISTGTLPDGITLNTSSGELSGTPVSPAIYAFAACVIDNAGFENCTNLTIEILDDSTPPTGTISINSGSPLTDNNIVTLALSATDDIGAVTQMRFNNADTSTWSAWEPYSTAKSWTLTSTTGYKVVNVQFMDSAGNVSFAVHDGIQFDDSTVTGSVTINNDSALTASTDVTLSITGSSTAGTMSQMRFKNAGTSAWSAWEPYSTARPWTLTSTTGYKIVYAQFMDSEGNVSLAVNDGIQFDDNTVTGSVVIDNDSALTASTDVTLSITGSSTAGTISQMRFNNAGTSAWSPWEPYSTTRSWTLTQTTGYKIVNVQFIDSAGNVSRAASDGIQYDNNTVTGSVVIDNDSALTSSTDVTLSVSGSSTAGTISQMRFNNAGTSAWSPWEPYSTTRPWTLTQTTGYKIVYAQFMDSAGNVSRVASDGIQFDDSTVTGSVTINNDSALTATTDVTLSVAGSSTAGSIAQMRFNNAGSPAWSPWEPYSTTRSWTLASTTGYKIVNVQFIDSAGNVSRAVSDGIQYDDSTVTGSVSINNDSALTSSMDVTLSIAGSSTAGSISQMRFNNAGTSAWSAWEPYSTTRPWTLTPITGYKFVNVQFMDSAGNVSRAVSDGIQFDDSTVTGSVTINNDSALTSSTDVTLSVAGSSSSGTMSLMRFNNGGTSTWSAWEPYSTTRSWTLTPATGYKVVNVQFIDSAGNVSRAFSDGIQFDDSTVTGSITINNFKSLSNPTIAVLTLDASSTAGTVTEMRFYISGDPAWSSWEAYSTSKTLSLGSAGENRMIYVQFKDSAGNSSRAFSVWTGY